MAPSVRPARKFRPNVSPSKSEVTVPDRVRSLEDLLDFVIKNPTIARRLKHDPRSVAEIFGLELSEDEAELIQENMDMEQILSAAEAADSMAQKVASGIGLRTAE